MRLGGSMVVSMKDISRYIELCMWNYKDCVVAHSIYHSTYHF